MGSYRLSPHAFVCLTPEGAVFLDLKRDCYLGIDAVQARALATHVEGWPEDGALATLADDISRDFAESLREQGLLVHASVETVHSAAGCPLHVEPPPPGRLKRELAMAETELIAWEHMPWRHIRARHILRFAWALMIAIVFMRCRSLQAAVRRYQRRREQLVRHPCRLDLIQTQDLVSAYSHLRLWAFARKGRCLLDSIALLEFLSLYGVHPHWVLGVQTRPFSAHSWVQHEHWVFNGTPAFVRGYTPILVV